jgi:hypothetical protein
MDGLEVLSHRPSVAQNVVTPRERACKSCRPPVGDAICLGGARLHPLLSHYPLLVDIIDVHQMMAEGAGLLQYPALWAFNAPCIPLDGSDLSPL